MKSIFFLVTSIFSLALIVGSGGFGVSYLRRDCAKQARELKRLEVEFSNLKRENEFWETQIARSKDPSILRKRAEGKLKASSPEQIIYAYRVKDSSGKQRFAASFRQPSTSRTSSTAQR